VTSRCNSRCRHCFYWKEISESSKKKEMTLDEIKKIAKNYGKLLYLSIGGGEPFMRKDLPEICEAFHRHTGVSFITLTTNGLDSKYIASEIERTLQKCPHVDFTVPLSIDGLEKTQDSIRGVKGCFSKVMETYAELSKLKLKYKNLAIDVNTVVSAYNIGEIEEVFEFVSEKMPGVRNHGICFARGATKEEKAKNVSAKRLREIMAFEKKIKELKRKDKSITDKVFDALSLLVNRTALDFVEGKPMNWNCLAGKKFVEINETGDVFPCEILFEKIGSLRENNYSVLEILSSKKAKEALMKISGRKCNCTFECAISNALVYSPRKYPELLSIMRKI
jgi:MoaA/NifB/PqqE/SkfB family radical SAM enzyme